MVSLTQTHHSTHSLHIHWSFLLRSKPEVSGLIWVSWWTTFMITARSYGVVFDSPAAVLPGLSCSLSMGCALEQLANKQNRVFV